MFFSEKSTLQSLEKFIRQSEQPTGGTKQESHMLFSAREVIRHISARPETWDERCSFNIAHVGDSLMKRINAFDPSKMNDVEDIFVLTYRFLREYELSIPSDKELNPELVRIKNDVEFGLTELTPDARSQITYAAYLMPATIIADMVRHPKFSSFSQFEEKTDEAERLKETWNDDLADREERVNALKAKLEEFETGFNFVGLYRGFAELSKTKLREQRFLITALIILAVCIALPLLLKLTGFWETSTSSSLELSSILELWLPLLSLELILIYFFRVLLHNYRSVKAQLMQIELRKTLCQFIQSYADYSADIKDRDKNALDRFEGVIFSGIVSDAEKLPSTFDGIDQLTQIIRSVRGDGT